MTDKLIGILIVVVAMAIESVAQVALKIGADGSIVADAAKRSLLIGRLPFPPSAWIALGVILYGVEIALYTLALSRLEVSTAYPLGSLCFVGVALLSRLFLGETVGRVRWLGIGCILAGTVFIAL